MCGEKEILSTTWGFCCSFSSSTPSPSKFLEIVDADVVVDDDEKVINFV